MFELWELLGAVDEYYSAMRWPDKLQYVKSEWFRKAGVVKTNRKVWQAQLENLKLMEEFTFLAHMAKEAKLLRSLGV